MIEQSEGIEGDVIAFTSASHLQKKRMHQFTPLPSSIRLIPTAIPRSGLEIKHPKRSTTAARTHRLSLSIVVTRLSS